MDKFEIYNDIAVRTGGDIYVGVVGPVRTGKSTFITKFMESFVLPNIKDKHKRERAVDELPQSGAGKTIMTTQPKFVPGESVRINLRDNLEVNVRLIDCVGYMVEGAMGVTEEGKQRLVKTPWSSLDMPFEKSAEIGTQKVINEHSTIGILVTTDGSITEIPRSGYIKSEERVVKELKDLNKPFIVVLNCKEPQSEDAQKLRSALQEKYSVPVLAIDVSNITPAEISAMFENVLLEFPLRRIDIELGEWLAALPATNPTVQEIAEEVKQLTYTMHRMRDYKTADTLFHNSNKFMPVQNIEVELGSGAIKCKVVARPELFYNVLAEITGENIDSEFKIMSFITSVSGNKRQYDRFNQALKEVEERGYGVVTPGMEEMRLEEPEMIRSGGRFGVRLKASAPSLHIMKVDINTEVSPIVGSEQQSEELIKYLLSEFENDPKGIWETNMFGKSLHNLVKENLNNKLHAMPTDAQNKMRKTLGRIVNEGKGGVICILL